MAIIPGVFSRVRQKSRAPVFRSSAGATPDAFGAATGRGLQAVGQGLSSLSFSLQEIQREEQETALKTFDVDATNRLRTLMHGDFENDLPGYLSTQNGEAVDGHSILRNTAMQLREELLSGIEDKKVQDRATIIMDRKLGQIFSQAAQHATSARRSQAINIAEARKDNAKSSAANNPDPNVINEGLAVIQSEVETLMAKQGHTDELVIANEIKKEQSELLVLSVASMQGQGDSEGAAAIFREYAEFMTPEDKVKVSVSLVKSLTLKRGQEIHDEVIGAGHRGQAARDRIKLLADTPQIREEAMSQVRVTESTLRTEENYQQQKENLQDRELGIELGQRARDMGAGGEEGRKYITDNSSGVVEETALRVYNAGEANARADAAALREENNRTQSELADQIVQDLVSQEPDLEKRRKLLDELSQDKYSATLLRQVNEKLARTETQERAEEAAQLKEARESASTYINDGGSFDDFNSENPGYADVLGKSPSHVATLRAMSKAQASGEIFAATSDGETLHSLLILPPEERAALNLAEFRHKLTQQEFDRLSQDVVAITRATNATGPERAIYKRGESILANILPKSQDFGSSKASNADREKNRLAVGAVNLSISNYIERNEGKPPSEPELHNLVYEATLTLYSDPPGFFNAEDIGIEDFRAMTSEQAAFSEYPGDANTIPSLRLNEMEEYAREGSEYPGGRDIPPDVLKQAYASVIIANRHPRLKIRREAIARVKQLLQGR